MFCGFNLCPCFCSSWFCLFGWYRGRRDWGCWNIIARVRQTGAREQWRGPRLDSREHVRPKSLSTSTRPMHGFKQDYTVTKSGGEGVRYGRRERKRESVDWGD